MKFKFRLHHFYLAVIFLLLVYLFQNPSNFEPVLKLLVITGWFFLIARFGFSGKTSILVALLMLLPALASLILGVEVIAVQLGTFIYAFLAIGIIQKFLEILKERRNEI